MARINKYIVENEPWVLARNEADAGKLDSVLFHSAESLRIVAVLLAPIMPEASRTIWRQLGLDPDPTSERLDQLAWSGDLAGSKPPGGESLFPRIESKSVYEKLEPREFLKPG